MTNSDCRVPGGTLVLCGHPLSDRFRSAIEEKLGGPFTQITLAALKANGPWSALRRLSQLRGDAVYVAYEEPEEAIFLPVICLASLLIRSPQRYLLDPECTPAKLPPFYLLKALADIAVGSMAAVWAGLRAFVELVLLEHAARARVRVPAAWRVVYLNANVMFGVKAGGSLGHIAGVVNALHSRKVGVLYVATSRSSVIDPSVPMQRLEIPPLLGLPLELFLFGLSQRACRQLRPLFVTETPTVIYQRMSRCNYTGAVLSRRHGIPLIMEYNGSEAWGARHWGRPMIFEKLARKAEVTSLRAAHLLVTVSEVLADELVALGIERSRIVVYPNCVDSAVFDPSRFDAAALASLRDAHGVPPQAIVLGFIGTFGRWHGIDVLCETIRLLVRDNAAWLDEFCVRFLLVGDGPGRVLVEDLLRDPACARYVIWPGLVEQSQAPVYLAAMDILLSPHVRNPDGSRFFGSPTKLFEYMSMCRPIVASGLDQIADVLSPALPVARLPAGGPDERADALAILVEPGEKEELAIAIRFLVERPEWRNVLGANARREVLKKYQWSHHVGSIVSGMDALREKEEPQVPAAARRREARS